MPTLPERWRGIPLFVDDRVLYYFSGLLGDFTQDGHVDMADLQSMLLALTNQSAYESQFGVDDFELQTVDDINHDGVFSNADIQAFLNLLILGGGSTASVPERRLFC